ncbi:methionine--tRNA ligase mes1 [Polyrhizophydium stewartii]|uniref:methionine--tRNA ligase n=1 Tax=Polyrhizophydium stewartii TaxID=2732419 RepID=A0ABR4NG00_9FUNG
MAVTPAQPALQVVATLPGALASAAALKLLLALEVAGTPYTVMPAPADGSAPAPFQAGVVLSVPATGTTLANANTAVQYVLRKHKSVHAWIRAKVDSFSEWDLHTLSPAVAAGMSASDPAAASAISFINDRFGDSVGFKPTSAAAVIFFANLYPVLATKAARQAVSAKFPTVVRWFEVFEKYPAYAAAVAAWKAQSSSAPSSVPAQLSGAKLPAPKVDGAVTITLDHHSRVILPKEGARNILITSALPYVNSIPHLGNIIGCVLSGDVFARFARIRGYNVLYVGGTDEYGTATETKAIEEKMSCKDLCDKYFKFHDESYKWFQIDFDKFGRTTTQRQTEITHDIYLKLEKNGHVLEDTMTQLYCIKHESFLADRFVEGTCPICGFEDARGDQCDGCGKLINAIELKNPRCKLDGASPIPRDSKHLFLDLKTQQPKLEEWFKKASADGAWSANSQTITNSWLKEGLKPRCITRDLKWGTSVPRKGYENKVFYVWFDAPIGYLSITANYTKDWEKWWKNPKNVQLYQFMGKDNVAFHTVIFPSTLIGTSDNWTLLHHLSTTEYLQYESGKFSKSRGIGVFGNNAADSGIPVEVWRYYLLSIRPENSDSLFSWNSFIACNNGELLANLGNFVNRVVKFINAKYDGVIPAYAVTEGPEKKLIEDVNVLLKQYVEALEAVKIRQGLRLFMDISSLGNLYLQDNRIDNNLFANSRERCNNVVAVAANLAYLISSLVYPYMPSTTDGILRQLNLPLRRVTDSWAATDILAGHKIGAAEYLFKKIEESREEELRLKYSGKQGPSQPATAATDAKGKQPMSKRAAKSARPAPTGVPEGVTRTPEMEALEKKIAEQGNLVRQLKADKAAAGDIKTAVDGLLALKAELAALVAA